MFFFEFKREDKDKLEMLLWLDRSPETWCYWLIINQSITVKSLTDFKNDLIDNQRGTQIQ